MIYTNDFHHNTQYKNVRKIWLYQKDNQKP